MRGTIKLAKETRKLSFDEFADELLLENQPRALIILASSQIDYQLRNILEQFFWPKTAKTKEEDELLEGDNPLGTFSSRIKLAKRVGLVDLELYSLLNKLRIIRNNAAHWIVFGVADSPLRENIRDLRAKVVGRKSYELTTKKYFQNEELTDVESLKSVLLTMCVIVASIESVVGKFSLRNYKQLTLD